MMNRDEPIVDFKTKAGISNLLTERYGERGKAAAERLQLWVSGAVPMAFPDILAKHLEKEHVPLLFDAFWQVLPFGTGGRRGRVGYGSNRFNPTTVAMTVQGHCNYLSAAFPGKELSVIVANDVRVFNDLAGVYRFLGSDHPLLGTSSRSIAKLACEIYAGNGVVAYLAEPEADQSLLSTPELSFFIRKLQALGGVNISASHNPPDDNGIKVYDEYGGQPIPPHDQRLADAMDQVTDVRRIPFAEALGRALIREIPVGLHGEYIDEYVRLYGHVFTPRPDIPVVYTPLCGCGLRSAGAVMQKLGFPILSPPDQGPDGTFAPIPFKAPNPEVSEATVPATRFAESVGSGVVLSSDPDADRVGLEARLADGSWYHFDGNKIATLLCYYLMLDPDGPQRRGLVMETLVTTKILGRIAATAGDSWIIDDLLVGFKYMANVLKILEQRGRWGNVCTRPESLVLATEEAHGLMLTSAIRDKDSAPACMFLAALYQKVRLEGRNLLDYYVEILEKLGGYADTGRSIVMTGAEGGIQRDRIVASLRASLPKTLGGRAVRKVVDYWNEDLFGKLQSSTDQLSRNVLQFFLDGCIVTIRPSGTEPKLKFYCQLVPFETPQGRTAGPALRGMELMRDLTQQVETLARAVYQELLARLDLRLGEPALLLPDIIDIGRKQEFERNTIPKLREAIAQGRFRNLADLLDWLRGEVAAMTPGADPLPALRAGVTYLCREWENELGGAPLLAELAAWAGPRQHA
ncbi:MAG: phospho-sugar mutase [Terriglobia bacterium]|jgi:phosphoglucomutase/phosphomannomutase